MSDVSIRDLRNRGGEIVARAARGEPITITSSGEPVAELRALGPRPLSPERLIELWKGLPAVDPRALRTDIDREIDSRP